MLKNDQDIVHDTDALDESNMLTIAEVARYLKLHELTVRRLAREGELPAFKVGRQWRIKRNLLENWIAERSGKGSLEG